MTARLHPALEACVQNGMLCHPLLGTRPYERHFNLIYNRAYARKRELLQRAEASGHWADAIQLYDRPFRPTALQTLAMQMDDAEYWRLVAEVWIDAENVIAETARWTQLWSSTRPCRDQVMTAAEHERLRRLKDQVVAIYRGCDDPTIIDGLSWTFNAKVGVGARIIVTAEIPKQHIQAFFAHRRPGRRDEVVALPHHYKIIDVREHTRDGAVPD